MQNRETKKRFAIDVCNPNYIKSVGCDVPISEGYGPGNLISNNAMVRSKGFLAERFIKPPVTLTFDFKCEIDLRYVVIDCCVGAQKTNGIELFIQKSSNQDMYESVASGVLPDEKRGFVFHRYNENVSERFGGNFLLRTFKYRSSQLLSLVQSIKIKIFRTGGTCVPALGKLNVFGIPQKIEDLNKSSSIQSGEMKTTKNPSIDPPCTFGNNSPVSTTNYHDDKRNLNPGRHLYFESKRCLAVDQNVTIPEDFIDPITCEIMTQPVILPSGKVIDYSTLEKYEKVESSCGRGPNDPFTGVPFNDLKKAVAASDLKARIDKFLTKNCNSTELKSIPRTLGKDSSPSAVHPNSVSTGIRTSKLINTFPSSTASTSINVSIERGTTTHNLIETLPKRRKIDSCPSLKSTQNPTANGFVEKEHTISSSCDNGTKIYFPNTSYCQPKLKKKALFCPNTMESSLENALKSTLSKLPNLTADKSSEDEGTLATHCQVCNSKDNLFSIPCMHLICRQCLINARSNKMISLKCSKCSISFESSDVKKVHVQ